MRYIYMLLTVGLAFSPFAMANPELNGSDVFSDHLDISKAPDPSARSVIIQFNKDGVPVAVAHSDKDRVKTSELDKLVFAQVVAAAEEPNNLPNSTPSTEKNNAQGTPQWGFAGRGFAGGIYRGPNGGVIAAGRGWGGVGYGGGYYGGGGAGWGGGYYGGGAGWGGGGWGGWNTGWNTGWGGGCGWGGCGCQGCQTPIYIFAGCMYQPVGFFGGGWGGAGWGGGGFYGMYQPSFYN